MDCKAENCPLAFEMVVRLLRDRLDTGYMGMDYSEIVMICTMLGIRKSEDC